MSRIRRILFHTAVTGSVLVLVCVLIAWPWSYFQKAGISCSAGTGSDCIIASWAGRFVVVQESYEIFPPGIDCFSSPLQFKRSWQEWSYWDRPVDSDFRKSSYLGCEYAVARVGKAAYPSAAILVPYSYLATLSAILPAAGLVALLKRRRRLRRRAQGHCSACGYDLHAHNPGDKCPECGTLFATETRK